MIGWAGRRAHRPGPADPGRLRDHAGKPGDVAARAGAIIRAVSPPQPLDPRLGPRVLAGIARANAPHGWRPQRLVLAALAVAAVGASGAGAAAALGWIEVPWWSAPVPASRPLPAVPRPAAPRVVRAEPAVAAATPAPPRRRAAALSPQPMEPARLAIDPRARAHRVRLPDGFARRHAGQEFVWQLKLCISASGAVDSARLVAPVHPQLDRRLLRAVASWRYHPARVGARAVASCPDVVYRLTVEPPAPLKG